MTRTTRPTSTVPRGSAADDSGAALPPAMVWEGREVPCRVRVVVYQAGQAAAAGLRATDPRGLAALLGEAAFASAFPAMLEAELRREAIWQGVTSGIQDEEIAAVISQFVAAAGKASPDTVSRRIASGQLPEAGTDSRLEYVLNPGYLPLHAMPRAQRQRAGPQVHQVRQGQTLILRHPSADAQPGVTVRGESICPKGGQRHQSLGALAGLNTEVKGERLIATAEGVYREDERGRVKVIQELVVDTVSPATGDLPRSGVASVNAFIRRGVTSGASVQTTEDVFVGTPREPGTLDPGTRLRARHLLVRGLVAGGVLPGPLLDGELDALDPAEQRDIRSELDRSEIQVEGILAAREIAGRNLAAGQVLVQGSVRGAALEVVGDVRVDGDLIGGVVSCSGTLFVAGDLGAGAGTPTRLRLGVEGPLARRRGQLSEELRQQRHRQQERLEALAAHDSTMATRGRRSPFWAALMAGQKRPPARPVERRLLVQFLEASRERKRLEAALYETQQEVEGTERLVAGLAAEDDGGGSGVRILVGGRTYPGVVLEAVRPMTPEDGPREVLDRVGRRTTLADLRRSLTERVEHYISLYEPSVDERRETLDRIFEGAERRPSAPRVPDRRFEVALGFPEAEGDAPLRLEGAMFLRAHDPDTPYLKHRAVVLAVLRRAAISIEETAGHLAFRCSPGQAIVRPWQEDEETLAVLEGFAVTGTSGRQHLLA